MATTPDIPAAADDAAALLAAALALQEQAAQAWAEYRNAVAAGCSTATTPATPRPDPDAPVADPATFSIVHKGHRCPVGNGISFRLFERLTRRVGVFVPFDALRRDVWAGRVVEPGTVRQAVHRLRQRLRDGGLSGVADAIAGEAGGFYVLRPVWRSENVTQTARICRAGCDKARR